jgi:hypothetical protein
MAPSKRSRAYSARPQRRSRGAIIETLYAPNQERVVSTNAWAFMHWLRAEHRVDLPGWAALSRFSAERPDAFRTALASFARLSDAPHCLARHPGSHEAVAVRTLDAGRIALSHDQVRDIYLGVAPPTGLSAELTAQLARAWPRHLLIRPVAELLLHSDLRPDDRLLVANNSVWPWLAALLEGALVILATTTPALMLAISAAEAATILVAPAQALTEATFPRPRDRPDLGRLRSIIATGGPLSPEGRRRIYTWVKADVVLLARSGDAFWGNPLEPVLVRPTASPGFFRRLAADRPPA